MQDPLNQLIIWPHSILDRPAETVVSFDKSLKQLADSMFSIMKENNGIGIAAPQVGKSKKVIMWWDKRLDPNQPDGILVNPEIVWKSEAVVEQEEGCLSLPGIAVNVQRAYRVRVKGKDITGKEIEVEEEGVTAACLQHEYEHLEGKTIIRYVSKLKRDIIKAKLKKKEVNGVNAGKT